MSKSQVFSALMLPIYVLHVSFHMDISSWGATPTADEIIEEIEKNGSYTLKPRKIVAFIWFAIFSWFAYLGIETIQDGGFGALGYIAAIFFGFGAVLSLCDLIGYLNLCITPEGFTVRLLLRSRFYRWEDVKYFRTVLVSFGGRWAVCGFYNPKKRPPPWTLQETNISEHEIPNPYNMSSQTLIELLTALQTHFLYFNSHSSVNMKR